MWGSGEMMQLTKPPRSQQTVETTILQRSPAEASTCPSESIFGENGREDGIYSYNTTLIYTRLVARPPWVLETLTLSCRGIEGTKPQNSSLGILCDMYARWGLVVLQVPFNEGIHKCSELLYHKDPTYRLPPDHMEVCHEKMTDGEMRRIPTWRGIKKKSDPWPPITNIRGNGQDYE